MYEIIELAANIIDIGIMMYVADKSFQKKERYNAKIIFVLIILQSLFMRYTNEILGNASMVSSVINIAIFFFIASFFYKITVKKLVGVYSLLFLTMLIIEGFISTFMDSVLNADMAELLKYETIYRTSATIISKALIIIFVFNIAHVLSEKRVDKIKYFPLISMVLVVNIILHLLMLELYTGNIERYFNISLAVLMFFILINLINIFSFFMIIKMVKHTEEKTRWEMTRTEYEKQIEYLKDYSLISKEIGQLKHDLSKHIISLGSYLDMGQFHEAKAYIEELSDDYKDIDTILSIENKIISSIVNYKMKAINDSNIVFNFYSDVPEKIHVKDVDLTIIISNILDNAIEACDRVPSNIHKKIDFTMEYENNNLLIKESNTFDGILLSDRDKILTVKKDKSNHGFGIQNIKKTVKKYEGFCHITADKDKYIIEISL